MTEDDTFRVLKRTPFIEVLEIIDQMYGNTFSSSDRNKVINDHGWEVVEYWIEWVKRDLNDRR